ncbi:hypothetical protein ACFVS2_26750 [Brevibacillus sp. NPDC058079]|uniref:hypothetical protein n=1 Tax=Brevibacillus sp. NPDC058079 TaxID=3346330 RepID=UPI0036E872E1
METIQMITLLNTDTGETLKSDLLFVHETGVPDGFVIADNLSRDEWIKMLQDTIQKFTPKSNTFYSNMLDIDHPDAEWFKIHYIQDGVAHCSRIKGRDLNDVYFDLPLDLLRKMAIEEVNPTKRMNEILSLISSCYNEGFNEKLTTNAALEIFSAHEIRACLLERYTFSNNPCNSMELWIEESISKMFQEYEQENE